MCLYGNANVLGLVLTNYDKLWQIITVIKMNWQLLFHKIYIYFFFCFSTWPSIYGRRKNQIRIKSAISADFLRRIFSHKINKRLAESSKVKFVVFTKVVWIDIDLRPSPRGIVFRDGVWAAVDAPDEKIGDKNDQRARKPTFWEKNIAQKVAHYILTSSFFEDFFIEVRSGQ